MEPNECLCAVIYSRLSEWARALRALTAIALFGARRGAGTETFPLPLLSIAFPIEEAARLHTEPIATQGPGAWGASPPTSRLFHTRGVCL
jgi:hypothetical protein